MAMELRQLRQFTSVAETLNFREAAERLNMAQPPLSVSIRKLEEEMGARLFDRDKSSVRLTEAGRAALEDAHKALFHAEEAKRRVRATTLGISGRLRIGFVGSAKFALIPRLLPLFRQRYPDVAIELAEHRNIEIIQAIESRNFDVGIIRVPFPWGGRIRTEAVEQDHFVAALPSGHPLTAKRAVKLSDIAKEPFVHYATGPFAVLHMLTMMLFENSGYTPRLTQAAVHVDTAICLVRSGLGVALVPSVAARQPVNGVTFRELSPRPAADSIRLAIAYDPGYETLLARRFRELALDTRERAQPPLPRTGRARPSVRNF
jgi:DNA-binding transcriptional LysR family regulator